MPNYRLFNGETYVIRWLYNGRVHEVVIRGSAQDTAIMTFEALFDQGYRNVELWSGAKQLR